MVFGIKNRKKEVQQELDQAYKKLKESYMETVLCFSLAAEYKDTDTGQHIMRIRDYSVVIAEALGLSKEDIETLKYASIMHDIGKIGIPDSILQKTSILTDEERKAMQKHALIGSRILRNSSSPLLKAAAEIALAHHERYDGKGYPNGLKGEGIPLFARIVCLADSFDAMVSKRCYKDKVSFEEALNRIQQDSGKQFDPVLAKIFLEHQDKIKQILSANVTIEQFANNP